MRRIRGFTLQEIIIAMAISSFLLGSAVPAMRSMLLNSRRCAVVNDLLTSIQLARSESLKRRAVVTLCPSADGATCATASQWNSGWLVYANVDQNYSGAEPDAGEPVLRYTSSAGSGVRISAGERSHFSFRAFDINSDNGTITLCDERGAGAAAERRAIIISTTGRPRLSTKTWDGQPLDC
jgi:type IV fimbrial biogenesis protein FimT